MSLWKYDGKTVKLTDVYGQTIIGIADYHSAENNTSGIDSLAIETSDDNGGILIEFDEPEIVNVEVLYAVSQNLAVAV